MVSSTSHNAQRHPSATASVVSVQPLEGVRAGSALVRYRHRLLLAQARSEDLTLASRDRIFKPYGARLAW